MRRKAMAGMVVAALFLAALSQPVLAQQAPGGGMGPGMMREGTGKELTPEQFSEMKARVLKLLEERRTRLGQEKACVEKAANSEELRNCRPERPMRPGGGMQGDHGQHRPARPDGDQRQ